MTFAYPNATLNQVALIANNFIAIPEAADALEPLQLQDTLMATVLANMAYFGYVPSVAAMCLLKVLSRDELVNFWLEVEPAFKQLTGADRNMGDFVVYKNFPAEVLDMPQAQYWFNQIFMYMGAPNEWFVQEVAEREALDERLKLKVLAPATERSLETVYETLVANKARWTDMQNEHAAHLIHALPARALNLASFGFKENGIKLIAAALTTEGELTIDDATDVLRLAAALSKADVSLRTAVKFRTFNRSERRLLLSFLDESKNLVADVAARPSLWKKLMAKLRPGDFKFKNVIEAYHLLYQGDLVTFNAEVEALLFAKDATVLTKLQSRPGNFARRLHKLYELFGMAVVPAFAAVVDNLETSQLVKLNGYLATVDARKFLIHPPRGNWAKAQFLPNEKAKFSLQALAGLKASISGVLATRMAQAFPEGVDLAVETKDIKLQTNDQELAAYGRGTVFPIPEQMTFLRVASFWKHKVEEQNVWFDNGVNFFTAEWAPAGTCCWSTFDQMGDAAVFSGDPTNSKEDEGRACQMIDLNLDKLAARGVQYAVWNVLCYSGIPFSGADDVLATLQWGENAESGELYEPSRAQLVFPLQGEGRTKYVAYIDIQQRKLVYMDANLSGIVSSADSNAAQLAERMPAFLEYLASLPSVADLFINAPQGKTPVLYSDAGRALAAGEKAYVFKSENPENSFEVINLAELL